MTRLAAVMAAALLAVPARAVAQAPPVSSERGIDFSLGGTFLAPAPAGSSSADLIASSGSRLTLFDVESRFGPGLGADASLAFRASPSVWIEAAVGWSRTSAKSRISDDLENAPDVTITEPIARFSGEGAVVWYFADRGTTAFFVRGSGGWMRELAGDYTLGENGIIGSGGAGLRHWWRQDRSGAIKRVGLRLEGRIIVRTKGLEFGSNAVRATPAATALIVFGF